ncbi:zonular occludens toxin domain-containing protein [Trichlorobacter ammonificans]|uniref:Zona occludens toxin N-terminal domain-containing protein n=1 Tax=Trichlorobacter ammonificans TaxID=2916410 RepID=A0ABM9DA73_9BACT|nr:zonular occludens toxin domain-containing protein [Trichlorobacter ammonificans]CAH2032105.1 protein of unknown function [Trichlorobacter ammonificans]
MIVFYVGTPGSGKSYEAVKKIIDNLRLGRTVCTNLDGMDDPKCIEYIKAAFNLDDYEFGRLFIYLSKPDVAQFWKTRRVNKTLHLPDGSVDTVPVDEHICPPGSLIVIDEVHKHFNARSWQSQANNEMADWASTHRHAGYDLILITQDIDKVEKQVRSLTEWSYLFRQVNFLGSAVKRKYLCYAYTGDEHRGTPLSKSVRTYNPKYFPCYKSYSSKDAKEVGFMQHANILRHPIFYSIPLVLAFCIWMFSKSSLATGDVFGTDKKLKQTQQQIDAMRKPVSAKPLPTHAIQPRNSSAVAAPAVFPDSSSPAAPSSSLPSWRPYHVQGYLRDGARTLYMVNGVTLDQTKCRNFDRATRTVECFGPDLSAPSPGSPGSPASFSSPSAFAPAPVEKRDIHALPSGEMYATRSVHLSDRHVTERISPPDLPHEQRSPALAVTREMRATRSIPGSDKKITEEVTYP